MYNGCSEAKSNQGVRCRGSGIPVFLREWQSAEPNRQPTAQINPAWPSQAAIRVDRESVTSNHKDEATRSLRKTVQTDPFIDDIYEAAIIPEKWQAVLDRLAEIADAEGTLLFAAGPGVPRWLSSEAIQPIMEEWIASKWYLDNPRGQRLVPIEEPRFLTDLDAFTAEEIDASDFYTELLRPRGLGWCVGTSIRSPAGDTLVFSIEKAHSKGPVPRTI